MYTIAIQMNTVAVLNYTITVQMYNIAVKMYTFSVKIYVFHVQKYAITVQILSLHRCTLLFLQQLNSLCSQLQYICIHQLFSLVLSVIVQQLSQLRRNLAIFRILTHHNCIFSTLYDNTHCNCLYIHQKPDWLRILIIGAFQWI